MKRPLFILLAATSASAHSMYQSAVILDLSGSTVRAELQLPVSRVELAFGQPLNFAALTAYVFSRFSASLPDGRPFAIHPDQPLTVQTIDGAPYLVAHLTLISPSQSDPLLFDLHDDVLLDRVPSQVALVSIRSDWNTSTFANDPQLLGVLNKNVRSLRIDRKNASWFRGFGSVFHLGMRHIAEGTDHLLFLLVLLLPAPLIVIHHRWAAFASVPHSLLQILKVVTAFTAGHSITLAAAALGLIQLPGRPIEVLIAFSILISAIHAFRPLFAGREPFIAGGFGLVHGLGFASTIAELGLCRWERVASIFGFNLGIETMQLIVVAATMPSLILLSRTRFYPIIRLNGAIFAAIASSAWIGQRLFNMPNPLDGLIEAFARQSQWIALSLFTLALGCLALHRSATKLR